MIRTVSFAALALLASTAAVAGTDSRIRSVAYDPEQIVRIVGKSGIQSTIEFAADEKIENVAVGDSSKWQITPNRRASLLFVKPLAAHSRTNMTVVTDKRTYMFDLVAGDASAAAVYALKFSYPNEKKVEAPKPAQQVASSNSRPTAGAIAEKLRFDWKSNGNKALLPTRVFDDGTSVYLAWDKETPLPAILTQNEDRQEGPVNYQLRGEYIVITPVPANLVLRYGKRSAALWPTRQVIPPSRPVAPDTRVAATTPAPVPPPAIAAAPPPAPSVKLANMTSLYSDKVTDNGR
jgi:type IV secretion system protein VirB9